MRKLTLLFLVFGFLLFTFCEAYAQDRNRITGFVFDESRRPVGQIYVELQNDLYSTVSRSRTQGSGMYTFAGLPAGQYYVKVLGLGTDFEDQIQSVSLVPVSVVQGRGVATEQVDFYLRKKKPRNDPTSTPGVIFAQEIPAEAKTYYEAGVNDIASKRDEEGLGKIKRSIEIFPDYFLALDRLGNEYVSRGHYEAAYLLLTKALSVNKRSFSSTLGLGVATYRLGQNDRAAELFQQAVSLDKGSINAHLWLGILLHAKGDLSNALKSLLEANKLGGETVAEVHWQLARVYKDQKKYAEAANELELFLKHRPDAQNAEEIKQIVASLRQKK